MNKVVLRCARYAGPALLHFVLHSATQLLASPNVKMNKDGKILYPIPCCVASSIGRFHLRGVDIQQEERQMCPSNAGK